MMSECNDIRWALERIEKIAKRVEDRQLGKRETVALNLLSSAVESEIVCAALGPDWVKRVNLLLA
jgi:hypothetical protein